MFRRNHIIWEHPVRICLCAITIIACWIFIGWWVSGGMADFARYIISFFGG